MDDRRLTCPASLLHINNSRGVCIEQVLVFRGISCYRSPVAVRRADHHRLCGEKDGNSAVLDEKREYMIFIEIEDKTLYLLDGNTCVKEYRIASGKSGYPSPLGCWTIIEKGDWGEGFGGRWLGLDVPWGKYGIHGTRESGSIGTAASHGCIRMFNEDVAELYDLVDIGTEVVIVNGQFGPFGRKFDEINPGDRGADVLAIQRRLKAAWLL